MWGLEQLESWLDEDITYTKLSIMSRNFKGRLATEAEIHDMQVRYDALVEVFQKVKELLDGNQHPTE
jgi:hypothetical protein